MVAVVAVAVAVAGLLGLEDDLGGAEAEGLEGESASRCGHDVNLRKLERGREVSDGRGEERR